MVRGLLGRAPVGGDFPAHLVPIYVARRGLKMSKQDYDEKNEKSGRNEKDEKDFQKRDEKEEKSAEEKWQRDPLGAMVWAVILIWAGVVLLAANLGALELLQDFTDRLPLVSDVFPWEGWSLFFFGAALILFLEVLIRLLVPAYRRPLLGTIIVATVFLGIGLGTWYCIFPLILIALGISLLVRNVRPRDKG